MSCVVILIKYKTRQAVVWLYMMVDATNERRSYVYKANARFWFLRPI